MVMGSLVFLVAAAVSVMAFFACAWITRAGYWRAAAALIGGLVGGALAFAMDTAAFEFGWWRYGATQSHAPILAYVPVVFWFGAGLGLVGWRMMRSWNGAGEIAFFLIFMLFGLARDLTMAQGGADFAFAPGGWPLAISAATWLAIAFTTQLVMQLLVGSVDADALEPDLLSPLADDEVARFMSWDGHDRHA
jgi:hypothetical protein